MTMTVARLHRALTKLIADGHGRKPVVVNKDTFRHPLEADGVVLLDVADVSGPRWIPTADDDGGTKWNADGTESGRRVVILRGEREDEQDEALRAPQEQEPAR